MKSTMVNWFLIFEKIVNAFFKALLNSSAFFLIILVLVTTEQVIARYLFQSSSIGMQELEWHLFALIFLFSMTWCLKENKHVRIDIFYSAFSERTKNKIKFIGNLLFLFPFSLVLLKYGLDFTSQSRSYSNSLPLDYFTAFFVGKENSWYSVLISLESYINPWLVKGEVSPDPGGLPFRWIIKASIPLTGFSLLLHCIVENMRFILIEFPKNKVI